MERREFLEKSMAIGLLGSFVESSIASGITKQTKKMPVIFVGHGSPMNAISANEFTKTLTKWGSELGKPTAIVMVSAHWLSNNTTFVQAGLNQEVIYDFGGFPQDLYNIKYPAKGNPALAKEIAQKVKFAPVKTTEEWGLDHGSWTILKFLFPQADVPVFQLSIDYSKDANFHYQLGKELAFLREKGVLIIGSGNIVHNLRMTDRNTPINVVSRDWALELDQGVKSAILNGDTKRLIDYQSIQGANFGIATPDHYYPFIYALGASYNTSKVEQKYEGFQAGTLSMRCVQWS